MKVIPELKRGDMVNGNLEFMVNGKLILTLTVRVNY